MCYNNQNDTRREIQIMMSPRLMFATWQLVEAKDYKHGVYPKQYSGSFCDGAVVWKIKTEKERRLLCFVDSFDHPHSIDGDMEFSDDKGFVWASTLVACDITRYFIFKVMDIESYRIIFKNFVGGGSFPHDFYCESDLHAFFRRWITTTPMQINSGYAQYLRTLRNDPDKIDTTYFDKIVP